ncbi:hypothetical protein FOWG_17581 [Fusarium oxysporum f. sp. lycopersici MN25]|nr:hypothetical protein FOWG_17581 [Fusarium oxysporum f. sp. lycopersici MN25]
MLSVCVRNSRDDPTNKDMQTGAFYEQVTLYENEEGHELTKKVKAENDPEVYDPETFGKTIGEFGRTKHIEWDKLAEDDLAGDSKESNYKPNSYHSPRTWEEVAAMPFH